MTFRNERGSFYYEHPIFGTRKVNARSDLQKNLELLPLPRQDGRQDYNTSKRDAVIITSKEFQIFAQDQPIVPSAPAPGWRFHAAFGCLCLVNLVCALDATSLAIVAEKLHANAIKASWWGTSFLLTATVFQPTFAALSHAFGRKPLLLVALVFFTADAIIAALANNSTTMLVGRSIQGVGGGGISALTYVIVTDLVTLKDRGKWFGLISMMWAFGSVAGPVIGGALAEKASWRWIFWLNMPFCVLGFITIPVFLKMAPVKGGLQDKIVRIDWIGVARFFSSARSLRFSCPLTWGGLMFPWSYRKTLLPMGIGIVGLLAFMLWSCTVSSEPILRGSMFKSPTALVSYFGSVVHGMFLWSALYYMPLYFEGAKGFTPIEAGIGLFSWRFTTGPSAVNVGIVVAKTGKYRWAIWSGWVLTATGIGLMSLFKADTRTWETWEWVFLSLVSGIGLGILYPAMSIAIQASASNADLPSAAALYCFFRNFGQMLGVAVGGAIFQNKVKYNMSGYADLADKAVEYSKDAAALVEVIRKMPPELVEVKHEINTSYVDSLRFLWLVMCAFAVLALVVGTHTKEISLEKELETEQGWQGNARSEERVDTNLKEQSRVVSTPPARSVSIYGGI
ncbi:MFS general substrate transporter [Tothia fuscella]|uniref:MFS general substrate transporter n=1 Tax=Tothia fuscella TaxID=1048955 RepID=A0A9P4TVK2_9PEZI|nr:MFS general substrate transporter [Tothia fuscella]